MAIVVGGSRNGRRQKEIGARMVVKGDMVGAFAQEVYGSLVYRGAVVKTADAGWRVESADQRTKKMVIDRKKEQFVALKFFLVPWLVCL